jgi:inositol 1,4,5-triphosphate receptor type 1
MFLRVLLNLVMHNYPTLVSGALQLLFRHFSQRQEVLQAFKQLGNLICIQLNLIVLKPKRLVLLLKI